MWKCRALPSELPSRKRTLTNLWLSVGKRFKIWWHYKRNWLDALSEWRTIWRPDRSACSRTAHTSGVIRGASCVYGGTPIALGSNGSRSIATDSARDDAAHVGRRFTSNEIWSSRLRDS